jgi:hypothetical protein
MSATTTITRDHMPAVGAPPGMWTKGRNPWVNDEILLSLSIWWVRYTRPETQDFPLEVAAVMTSLQDELT